MGLNSGGSIRFNYLLQIFIVININLVIEIDGGYHMTKEQKKKDAERTQILNSNNLRVIRFTNEEVDQDIENVLENIRVIIKELI